MRVGVGGTFNVIHAGHELLFETAFSIGDSVEVGLTSDGFARQAKAVPVKPFEERRTELARFLTRYGRPFEIVEISDSMGTAVDSDKLEAIVVSPETMDVAEEINERRRAKGLAPLEIHCISEVKADDRATISSSRIVRGEIDKDGHLLRPVRVGVATGNRVKLEAVRNVFTQVFGFVDVVEVATDPDGPGQPLGNRTVEGAIRRARTALERSHADFGVGGEAGLFYVESLTRHLDIQYCAIIDSSGSATYGHGPGFEYPPEVTKAALEGHAVGDIMSGITGIERIGHKSGSIGYLSGGLINRTSLTELAVLMALIPRIRPELYGACDQQVR
jgi:inosine/xanthosine triphosphatase